MALCSMELPYRRLRVPSSARAGSVAPIRARQRAIASGASRASTTAGPDDMKVVRLSKNGRSRCTA